MINLSYTSSGPRVPRDQWYPRLERQYGSVNLRVKGEEPFEVLIQNRKNWMKVQISESANGTTLFLPGPHLGLLLICIIIIICSPLTFGVGFAICVVYYLLFRSNQKRFSKGVIEALSKGDAQKGDAQKAEAPKAQFCSKCGGAISLNSKFCGACGQTA